jgi:hypothetical protein
MGLNRFLRRISRGFRQTAQDSEQGAVPKFIYRVVSTHTAKGVSIHSPGNFQTGLSFTELKPQLGEFVAYRVNVLVANGYRIKRDGAQTAINMWTGETYIEPNSGLTVPLPSHHVSVWHSDYGYWREWHEADLANIGTSDVSWQQFTFFELRDREESSV